MNRWEWAGKFLTAGGYPDGDANRTAIVAWAAAAASSASCNPLAATIGRDGATDAGTNNGVKNYPDLETGIDATVTTLAVDDFGYAEIRAALNAGDDPVRTARAIDDSQWGIKNVQLSLLNMLTNEQYAHQLGTAPVDGTGPAVPLNDPATAALPNQPADQAATTAQDPQAGPGATDTAPTPPSASADAAGLPDAQTAAATASGSTTPPDAPIVGAVSAANGGGWIVYADGTVKAIAPAAYFGSYQSLPDTERTDGARFVAAVAGPDGGYILVQDTWEGDAGGLVYFGPHIRPDVTASVTVEEHALPEGVTVEP